MKGKPEIYYRASRFAIEVIKNVRKFSVHPNYFKIINQIVRSSTSISANILEAQNARSRKEFISSNSIALKEAEETLHWLEMIKNLNLNSSVDLNKLMKENYEIVRIIASIISNSKKNLKNN